MRITQGTLPSFPNSADEEIKAVAGTNIFGEALYTKVIVCCRHFACICRKWRKGRDYSWHLQHLLREFGCGPLADLAKDRTVGLSRRVLEARLDVFSFQIRVIFKDLFL
jgi:hypothetical protein